MDVFEVLIQHADDHIERLEQHLSSGGCKDYSAYKEVTGKIQGLLIMRNYTKDLAKHQLESDDE